ncbi:uncharacterized protein PHACADRAFT_207938 [Phanerochaete carnosa HHB-10118-sp]|uniref:Carboxylic ester hydrolase n=1 Tax=Phanerochaete carnosa (strain HHB-10118-sp) TaxID=650164 RepID=K5X1T8_PHACS|nr:uncharacterized protein PHACADRAFT_207938 [Phanerochaete carnosa HHB-10118-sp]EKM56747.1 hypothetical protein PHACADRAFT_207938 [Phanerochaete carnosa HHB-10118-sp]
MKVFPELPSVYFGTVDWRMHRTLVALAATLELALAVDPLVNLGYTQYKGIALSNGVSQWLGMRFAAPPTGDLRFSAPADPPSNDTVQIANMHGPLCFTTGAGYPQSGHSEDCLFLDIYAPSNATTNSKLPVMFFIQGGGLNELANANYNGSQLIEAADFDMIVVTHNYRVGTFGFLASAEIQANGSINNGILDQRKAMQWVQDNIEQFGGDPEHVVLSGDSAGAQSITIHLTAYGGVHTDLFHGVIAESQSFPPVFNVSGNQYAYDALVERTGCNNESDTLACLRALDIAVLQNASVVISYPGRNNTPNYLYGAAVDGDLIPDIPYNLFAQGKFVDVPSVFGDDTNDGTIFTPHGLNSTEDMNNFLLDNFPFLTENDLSTIDTNYPIADQFPDHGEFYFNTASAYGEIRYLCPGIFVSDSLLQYNTHPVWNYQYNVTDPTELKEGLGVPHTIELNAIWGLNSTTGKPPASYFTTNANIIPVMQGYWTSFIRTLDPNTLRASGTAEWTQYDNVHRILFETNHTRMESIPDAQRQRCGFLASIAPSQQQ